MDRQALSETTGRAKDYYDSLDADEFYHKVWGGEDIHVGLYESDEDPIAEASEKTVVKMAGKLEAFSPGTHALDIGSGYGGSARYLARQNGYRVACLNLSERQNERNRELTIEQGLSVLVDVVDGSFEDLPFDDRSFDLVWSQDALLHGGDRERVFREVDRVLRPGGEFIFTDPMQTQQAAEEDLEPILERIQLDSLCDPETYAEYAKKLSWKTIEIELMPEQLARHYARVLSELRSREGELKQWCSPDYIERMKSGLQHWIRAGRSGSLTWGILRFGKPGP